VYKCSSLSRQKV